MDEVVSIIDDDSVVPARENLVKQGEQVLDAIEGVSGNKVVDDVMRGHGGHRKFGRERTSGEYLLGYL